MEHGECESRGKGVRSGNELTQSTSISERKERNDKGACLNHIVQCRLTCLWERQSKFLKNSWNHVKKTTSYDMYWYLRRRGWESYSFIFLSGACAVIWSLIWLALVRNSPSEQSWITREEVEYIEMSLAADIQEKVPLTYKSNNGRETRLEFRNMLITILL